MKEVWAHNLLEYENCVLVFTIDDTLVTQP
jgi:hypothetical protein